MARWAVALMVLTAGCVTELLEDDPATTRNIACAVLGGQLTMEVHVHRSGATLPLADGIDALLTTLMELSGRPVDEVAVRRHDATIPDWQAWAEDLRPLTRTTVELHFLVVSALPADGDTLLTLRPGVFVLSEAAVRDGAAAADLALEVAAGAVFLHAAGHALGLVNDGIPIASANLTGREHPMHHDADPTSIMNNHWHHRASMPKDQTVVLGYNDAAMADWQTAMTGVCA